MTFDEEGGPISSDPDNPIAKKKVEVTVHYLYLDSPRLVAARKRKWREVSEWIEEYRRVCPAEFNDCTLEDINRFERLRERLADISGPDAPYAATARACLRANSLDFLIRLPEEALAA